jgi:hypothetical protein
VILPNMFAAWVQALRSALRELPLTGVLARDVARLYLTILRAQPELGPDVNLARFVHDMLTLGQSMRGEQASRRLLLMLKSEDGDGAARQPGGGEERELLSRLIQQLGGQEVASLLDELNVESTRDITRSVSTRYGGVFLLAPSFAESALHELFEKSPYPKPSFASKAALFAYLSGLQCLGSSNAREARRDGGLALLAWLSAAPADAELKQYCEGLTTLMHEDFSREFQSWRRESLNRRAFIAGQESRPSEDERGAEGEGKDKDAWFSLFAQDEAVLPDPELDRALIPLSRAVLGSFAAKLGAFADSSPQYLSRNFLECHAEVLVSVDYVTVHFLTCPLQMVLRMAGFDQRTWALPWLENRQLEFRFD